jgi:hypothetical protein
LYFFGSYSKCLSGLMAFCHYYCYFSFHILSILPRRKSKYFSFVKTFFPFLLWYLSSYCFLIKPYKKIFH